VENRYFVYQQKLATCVRASYLVGHLSCYWTSAAVDVHQAFAIVLLLCHFFFGKDNNQDALVRFVQTNNRHSSSDSDHRSQKERTTKKVRCDWVRAVSFTPFAQQICFSESSNFYPDN